MELAKPALDVGLYTNQLDAMLAFWQEQAALQFSEMLPVGNGVRQHRHHIGDSILKINHSRHVLDNAPPSGLRHLTIYSDAVDEEMELLDPDGNELSLAPPITDAEGTNLLLNLTVSNLARHQDFYGDVLQLPSVANDTFAIGASRIKLSEGEVNVVERQALGYRYMTVQVFDVVGTHRHIVQQGGSEGMAPIKLGDVAYISFVCDPDGNWIEISQRKSLTGSLE